MANAPLKPTRVGRYALYGELASGGMGSVYLGRLVGPAGFSRTVAVKSLHPHLARDPEFVTMFLDEARLAARVVHPNVIPTLDVVTAEGGLYVVMEYVKGESLAGLLRSYQGEDGTPPIKIVATILANVLHGLHAAHETTNERGEPLGIVHRDVSPQNVLVGVDGVARLLDFGIAKATDRLHTTEEGRIKGKIAYMPPEQLRGESVNRQADIYAAAVVLWESLTGRRLFKTETQAALLEQILYGTIEPPSSVVPEISAALDAVVMRGLAQDRTERYATAREMAIALQAAVPLAASNDVGEWVEARAEESLRARADRVAAIESASALDVGNTEELVSSLTLAAAPAEGATTGIEIPVTVGTQISSISVAVPTPAPAPKRSRAMWLLAPLAVLAAIAVYATMNRPVHVVDATPAPSLPPMPDPVPTPTPEPVAVVVDASVPVASASAPAPAPVAKKKPVVNCDPPYTRVNGVKVYKRECL